MASKCHNCIYPWERKKCYWLKYDILWIVHTSSFQRCEKKNEPMKYVYFKNSLFWNNKDHLAVVLLVRMLIIVLISLAGIYTLEAMTFPKSYTRAMWEAQRGKTLRTGPESLSRVGYTDGVSSWTVPRQSVLFSKSLLETNSRQKRICQAQAIKISFWATKHPILLNIAYRQLNLWFKTP